MLLSVPRDDGSCWRSWCGLGEPTWTKEHLSSPGNQESDAASQAYRNCELLHQVLYVFKIMGDQEVSVEILTGKQHK